MAGRNAYTLRTGGSLSPLGVAPLSLSRSIGDRSREWTDRAGRSRRKQASKGEAPLAAVSPSPSDAPCVDGMKL